jgi:hypothetical protein
MTLSLKAFASALGGDVTAGQVIAPGPGHSKADRSMSVRPCTTHPDGFLVHSHAGDDWRACRDHVRQRLGLDTGSNKPAAQRHARRDDTADERRIAFARLIWDEAQDPRDTIVETYLASRGLKLPPECIGHAIRFHPACPWEKGRAPAMVAAFRDLGNSRIITGIHRTALTPQGGKVGRKMLGAARDAAIMLDPDENVTAGLSIAEGIESALAGRELGWRPVWALGSAGAIGRFPVLSGIECLTLLAETDDSGANAKAVQEVGTRWLRAGREVLVVKPECAGDMNDVLRVGRAA